MNEDALCPEAFCLKKAVKTMTCRGSFPEGKEELIVVVYLCEEHRNDARGS